MFHEIDLEVKLYDFNKMRMLVSDPTKKLCLELKISDISPVSMVPREHDQIRVCDSLKRLWRDPTTIDDDNDLYDFSQQEKVVKTQYLGKSKIRSRNLLGAYQGEEMLHLFYNEFSFLDFEEDFTKRGGVFGSRTLYMFREKVAGEDEDEEDANLPSEF